MVGKDKKMKKKKIKRQWLNVSIDELRKLADKLDKQIEEENKKLKQKISKQEKLIESFKKFLSPLAKDWLSKEDEEAWKDL